MNRKHIAAIVLTVLLTAGFALAQQAGPGPRGMGQGWQMDKPSGPPMGPRGDCMPMMNLTDEQRSNIQKLRLEHQRSMVEMKSETANYHSKLKLLIAGDKYSEKAVKDLAGKIGDAKKKHIQLKADHLRKVRNLLDDDQKIRFDQKVLSGGFDFGGHPGPGHGMKSGMDCSKRHKKHPKMHKGRGMPQ
ncbi:MAG: Spy/CpxP family protein refolding chaperone [Candidatus Hatepunaea meridiana]|nr:Spy/CpxP family protein refolding chaperone [Candidatus Hatepunaea meridiana]